MPMMPNDFPNFYLGAAAESMFAGEMYLLGYEAAKFNPDFGIDFLITNAARHKFFGEEEKKAQVQVKSTFAYSGRARIYVGEDDFLYLRESPRRFLVSYIFHDFYKTVDSDSANYRADPVEAACENDIAKYQSAQMEEHGAVIKRDDPKTVFEFRYNKRSVFWLNGAQLSFGHEMDDWKCVNNSFVADIEIEGSCIFLNGKPLFCELSDLENIMSEPRSAYSFISGKFSQDQV